MTFGCSGEGPQSRGHLPTAQDGWGTMEGGRVPSEHLAKVVGATLEALGDNGPGELLRRISVRVSPGQGKQWV